MSRFTRNKGQKRLRARAAGGRFRKATLEDIAPGWCVCATCRGFFQAFKFEGEPFPEKVRVPNCPHCGAPVAT